MKRLLTIVTLMIIGAMGLADDNYPMTTEANELPTVEDVRAELEYPDEYNVEQANDAIFVTDAATGEVVDVFDNCGKAEVVAEDGSCVPTRFYEGGNE